MADLPDSSWSRRVNISNGREIFVVPMLTAENVMRMLLCSRSSAYEHMNRALGRTDRPVGCSAFRWMSSRATSSTRSSSLQLGLESRSRAEACRGPGLH